MTKLTVNRVCQILGIEKPVIQAPMAWITSPELVAAVSNAGGLGCLGICAGFDKQVSTVEETVEEMRKSIRRTRELTNRPFAVNVFPSQMDSHGFSKATVELCKEEGVKILICTGVISPEDFKKWKEDGFTLIVREANPTVRGAIAAEKAGADIIVATGCDEGGSMPTNSYGTVAITALLSEAVNIPVLAAGGIINGKFAKASAIVGAEGAFVGTRFILSEENPAADNVKEDIMSTHPDDLIIFDNYNGYAKWRTTPHKVGKDAVEANKKGNKNPPTGNFFEGLIKGNLDACVNSVNNVCSLIKTIDPCSVIVDEIAAGYL